MTGKQYIRRKSNTFLQSSKKLKSVGILQTLFKNNTHQLIFCGFTFEGGATKSGSNFSS